MRYRMLGALAVERDGVSLDLGPHKQRALLALLLINADRVVSTDRIIDELWSGEAAEKEKALWVYISRLRAILEPERQKRTESVVISRHDHGYRLNTLDDEVDSHEFAELARMGRALSDSDPLEAAKLLESALQQWSGDALEDFTDEPFAEAERQRLTDLRAQVFEDRIEADLSQGLASELIVELETHIELHPYRERPVSQLMIALYRAGRPADSLRCFDRYRRLVGEELGIEPTPELAALEERVLLHDGRLRAPSAVQADPRTSHATAPNPYAGLRMFKGEDSERFFGRDRMVAEIVRRLGAGSPLVALVGASGSGKSSIVHAGVVPSIEKGAIEGSDHWPIASMVPGRRPFAELEAALNRATLESPGDLKAVLTSENDGILRALLRLLREPADRMLLVIDQFEELFTLTEPAERTAFLDSLSSALTDANGRLVLLLTLRADFYDRPLEHPGFASHLGDAVVNISSMAPEELEQAVTGPARFAGVTVEPALLTALVADVIGQPSALPLFQHALRELFDRLDDDEMNLDSYEAMGRIEGTLGRQAEDIHSTFTDVESHACRQILLRLVMIDDAGGWTRRRVPAAELLSIGLDAVAIQSVLERLSTHRLVTFDRDPIEGRAVIDVAHEALLTEWPRLSQWIAEAESDVRRHARLSAAVSEWRDSGEDPDYLFGGTRLGEHVEWAELSSIILDADQQAFLEASTQRQQQAIAATAEHESVVEALDRTANRRLRWLVAAVIALVATVGIVAGQFVDAPPRVAIIYPAKTIIDSQITTGLEHARQQFDISILEITPPFDDFESEVEAQISNGPSLVIVDEFFASEVTDLANRYPQLQWHFLQRTNDGAGFALEHAGYLAGLLAALESDGSVGFVGDHPDAASERLRAGFEAGVRAAEPDTQILATYALDDELSQATHEQTVAAAAEVFSLGASVVFGADGGDAVFEAAAATTDGSGVRRGIGLYIDHYFEVAPHLREHVLTSVVKRYDGIVQSVIAAHMEGRPVESLAEWGLAEEALAYVISGGGIRSSTALQVEELRAEVADGRRTVEQEPSQPLFTRPEAMARERATGGVRRW